MPRHTLIGLYLALALSAFPQPPRDEAYTAAYNLFQQKKWSEAEAAFQKIYSQDPPDLRGLMGLTEVYAAQNQFPRALQLLDAEMEKGAPPPFLKTAWANIAVRAGRFDDAIGVFQKLIEANPEDFDLHMRLAESYRLKQDLPSAIEVWTKAMRLNPESLTPILSRAMVLNQVGRKAEALAGYNDVLVRDPANLVANNNAAFFLADSNTDLDRALRLANTAVSLSPADPNVAETLAFVFLKRNEPQSAANLLRPLTRSHPKFLPLRIRLAEAALALGARDEAAAELAAARLLSPSAEQRTEIQRIQSQLR